MLNARHPSDPLNTFLNIFKKARISLHSKIINGHDEIKKYTEGRYISPSEAAHHIFQFDVHGQVLNVVRL